MFDWTKIESDEQIKELAALAKEIWNEYSIRFINQDQIDYMLEKFQSEQAMKNQIKFQRYRYYFLEEDGENWKITFLSGGDFVLNSDLNLDIFVVGGGGGGGTNCSSSPGFYCQAGGGGGGGYTATYLNQTIQTGTYQIVVGRGGGVGGSGGISYFKDSETYYGEISCRTNPTHLQQIDLFLHDIVHCSVLCC